MATKEITGIVAQVPVEIMWFEETAGCGFGSKEPNTSKDYRTFFRGAMQNVPLGHFLKF